MVVRDLELVADRPKNPRGRRRAGEYAGDRPPPSLSIPDDHCGLTEAMKLLQRVRLNAEEDPVGADR
jgi:hypothetical protein